MMFRKTLIAAALTALAAPVAAQDAGDFTARLNRLPGQAAAPTPEPEPQPTVAPEAGATPEAAAPPAEDITSRLNRLPGQTAQPTPEPEPEPEPVPMPEPEPAPPESEPEPEPEAVLDAEIQPMPQPDAAPEPATEPPPPPVLEILNSQADLAFRVDVPEAFDLVERPSGPDFDVYQVSRGDTAFVGVYVGCCSLFPIYDGRQTETAGRISVVVNEGGANRAVEHLFVRESDGRQIHVWLHGVTGEDRALAERIAQTVDPR
ncbi:hypothetical protein [Brevundimonas sp.]|uniref:hypothetical protein n=1 Tax=Brevundimonas sp. TaxID=1871086 RepID=UPI00391D01C8